jgi:hypothetical protein
MVCGIRRKDYEMSDYSTNTQAIFEQVRALIAPLDAEERLALIQAIAATPPPTDTPLEATLKQQHAQLAKEQAAWYALSAEERAPYRGEYVAIYQGQVVDHDPDQRALYIRVHKRYGRVPIPILNADWEQPPTYVIRHPRLERP